MIDVKKYAKRALLIAILLLMIYFFIPLYKFITIKLERERNILLAWSLQNHFRSKDLPNGEIKDIPLFFNENISTFICENKWVDRWGEPLDIKVIKTDEALTCTVISCGYRRFFFYREDIGVSIKTFFSSKRVKINYFP